MNLHLTHTIYTHNNDRRLQTIRNEEQFLIITQSVYFCFFRIIYLEMKLITVVLSLVGRLHRRTYHIYTSSSLSAFNCINFLQHISSALCKINGNALFILAITQNLTQFYNLQPTKLEHRNGTIT